MEEHLKVLMELNVFLLNQVTALQVVVAALVRIQPENHRAAVRTSADLLMAAAVGKHGLTAEAIQTAVEDLLTGKILGQPEAR